MFGKPCISQCSCLFFTLFCLSYFTLHGLAMNDGQSNINPVGPLFTKEERRTLAFTESGRISAVDIDVGRRGAYHLEFITLEPNSLLLPLHLHTDMVFYVQSGRGAVSWVGDKEKNEMDVERGDVYRLESGSVFYVRSHPDPAGVRLRIHALFTDIFEENPTMQEAFVTPYSNLSDMVRGFDDMVLQMAFRVSPEVIQRIKSVEAPPTIVPYPKKNETEEEGGGEDNPNWKKNIILEALIGGRRGALAADEDPNKSKKKKKTKTFNLFSRKPDFENCNGWSLAVTGKDLHALKGSNIGVFMVNLTKGSVMGPHWNPRANEIAIVTYGQGMVQVVCPGENPPLSSDSELPKCRNMRFKVKEGDVFVVPRFFPMAQMSFNDDLLVFMGFSTMARKNHPQFLAGRRSVFQTIDPDILAMSFSASNATTVREFLASQEESIILECASCAESAEKQMEAEEEKERQAEEEKRREEEEEQREEEEAKRREEEKQRQEEEEEKQRKREEEEKKQRAREEEEERRQEEEEQRRREKEEEEEQRKREKEEKEEEEEQRQREKEEKEEEEEEQRQREEEEKEEEEEEEQRQREKEEEEEEQRQRERERKEEERSEEEEKQREREEEEEQRQREEEEEEARGEEEEQRQEEEEEETRREEEEQRQREEEEWRGQGEGGEEGEREREEEWEEGQRGGGGGRRRKSWKV